MRGDLLARTFPLTLTGNRDGIPGGVLLAAPAKPSAATLTVPQASGRDYVLLCQLRDTVGGPTYAMLGMFHLVHVK